MQIPIRPKRRYRTKNASTKKFERQLKAFLKSNKIDFKNIQTTDRLEDLYSKFLNIIQNTCDKTLKKQRTTNNIFVDNRAPVKEKPCKSTI